MDYCLACEEYRQGIEIIDCGHQFCPECNLDRKLDDYQCPICKSTSITVELDPSVVIDGPATYQLLQKCEIKPLTNNTTKPEIDERYAKLKIKDDDPVLDEWYQSALKTWEINEDFLRFHNTRVETVQKLLDIATPNSEPSFLAKLLVVTERLTSPLRLCSNRLPVTYRWGQLQFTYRNYFQLTPLTKIETLAFHYQLIVDVSWDGQYFLRHGQKKGLICSFSNSRIITMPNIDYVSFIGNYILAVQNSFLLLYATDGSCLYRKQISTSVSAIRGDEISIYLSTQNKIFELNHRFELIRERDIDIFPSEKIILSGMFVYLCNHGTVQIYDRDTLKLVQEVPTIFNPTNLFFDRRNNTLITYGNRWINIYDQYLNLIQSSTEIYDYSCYGNPPRVFIDGRDNLLMMYNHYTLVF